MNMADHILQKGPKSKQLPKYD